MPPATMGPDQSLTRLELLAQNGNDAGAEESGFDVQAELRASSEAPLILSSIIHLR